MCISVDKIKQCEYCGNGIKAIARNDAIAKNWNRFCSKSCAAKMKFKTKSLTRVEELWPKVLEKYFNQVTFPKIKPKSVAEKFTIYCERHKESKTSIANLLTKDRISVLACVKCARGETSKLDKEKECCGCKKVLPLDCFRDCGVYSDGRKKKESRCRECRRKEQKDYIHNRRDKVSANKKAVEWRDKKREALGILKGQQSCKVSFIKCKVCDSLFVLNGWHLHKSTCSSECAVKYRGIKLKGLTRVREQKHYNCRSCGKLINAKKSNVNCGECKNDLRKAYKALRRKRIQDGLYELVKPNKVFNRDKWRCCVCKCNVQKKDILADNAAELDHIVPVSLGGVHTYTNVQTLCRRCNQNKSNKLVGQLTLAL